MTEDNTIYVTIDDVNNYKTLDALFDSLLDVAYSYRFRSPKTEIVLVCKTSRQYSQIDDLTKAWFTMTYLPEGFVDGGNLSGNRQGYKINWRGISLNIVQALEI